MFSNLKLRNRMLLGYSVPIVLMLGLSWISYSTAKKVSLSVRQTKISERVSAESNDALISINKSERAMRGYLLDRDKQSLKNYEKGIENFRQSVEAMAKTTEKAEQRVAIRKMLELGNRLEEFDRKLISLAQEGKIAEAVKLYSTRQGRTLLQEIDEVQSVIENKEVDILGASTSQAQSGSNFLISMSLLGTLFAIAIAIIAAYLLSSSITQMLTQAASAIASSSTEIAATAEQQERTITQQASSVNETTTTVDELGASSQQSAEQAEASAAGARQALTLAEGGTKSVQQNMEGMATLKEKVEAIADQILRLSEQTQQIGGISDLVADLANQTNMLALNAAVEAARAGEHGKGFGVVATEIRKLADQSKKSAEKINTLVGDIQAAINTTVMVTDEGTKTVDEGIRLAQGTAETFAGMADAIDNVFLNSQQISLSAKQQAIAVGQVLEAMNAINMGAKESASGITQVKVSTQQLNEASQKLKAVI